MALSRLHLLRPSPGMPSFRTRLVDAGSDSRYLGEPLRSEALSRVTSLLLLILKNVRLMVTALQA